MANTNLSQAKSAKNDEFYTQYADIQKEVNAYLDYDPDVFRGKTVLLPCDDPEWSNFTKFFAQNFERFGLRKLISTSYAVGSKKTKGYWQPSLFETESPKFDRKKTKVRGKIFILDHDTNQNGRIDHEDLEWDYLTGDGDFRSDEVKKLRDEADVIVTNPPFSLFREFLAWIVEADKKFLILGNKNALKDKLAVKDANGMEQYFSGLDRGVREALLETKLTIYICEGDGRPEDREREIKEWFRTINIAGVPLNEQELLNAIYSGPFVTRAKETFSNSKNAKMQMWKTYVKGSENRQDILRTALDWVSGGEIDAYMSLHRNDGTIDELNTYFETVVDWIDGVFSGIEDEMCGLDWGRLYEAYHGNAYDPAKVWARVRELYADECVRNRRGVFEYVLGGETEPRLLDLRVFEPRETKSVYARQTADAEARGVSNCPLCAVGHAANARRIWKFSEMDADHVTAWSKGGVTDLSNCQMLCRTHNRAKGNR